MTAASPHAEALETLLTRVGSDAACGLSHTRASAILTATGRNVLTATAPPAAWRRFLAQFRDVLVLLLLGATAVSATLWVVERDAPLPYEALAILAVVLLNATMGYVQEARAEAAVAALRAMSSPRATVVRDGERRTVAAADVVPGDVIIVAEGDTVPADARLLESTALQVAEAPLTGESVPVMKEVATLPAELPLGDRRNMVFSGTSITYGHGRAVVTATGMQTEMGHVARLLEQTPEETTPLQRELDRTGRWLGIVVVAMAVVMIVTIVIVERVHELGLLFDVLLLGVALAVAAVPEGLPAVVTAVLSMGVQRMAQRHAIVRHLAAVETLGSATVIASDKTGTLTQNEMTVRVVATASGRVAFDGIGYDPAGRARAEGADAIADALRQELDWALAIAASANNATLRRVHDRWTVQGDPTEGALLVAAARGGWPTGVLAERLPRIGEVPFSSARKLMSTLHHDAAQGHAAVVLVKGAPDVLLARCTSEWLGDRTRPLTDERRSAIMATSEGLAGEALRTLGVASRLAGTAAAGVASDDLEHDLTFAGLVGIIDPPRAEARDAVARARRAGVRPIMITGDHPQTALVIARDLGIADNARVLTGAQLQPLDDVQLRRTAADVAVYARVDPEHKLRIVDALRASGAIVAMTGDGVNDAPALKRADIGIAMGITGTDVSKEAADMVLADDNFASIVAAIEEGRAIFANIRKFLRYLLSSNIGEVLTMFFGVVLARPIGLDISGHAVVLPLLATQILWINLVTDGPPALALGVDPTDADAMTHPPRPPGEPVITRAMWRGIAVVGITMAVATLAVFDASLPGGLLDGRGDLRHAQTMAFTTLMLCQLFNVLNARSDSRSAFVGWASNGWLWAAIGGSLLLQIAVIHIPVLQQAFGTSPLQPRHWALCAAAASTVLWVREADKAVVRLARRDSRTA